MARWLAVLVLAIVMAATSSARAGEPSTCGASTVVLPAPGAVDVPRNTKVWVVGDAAGGSAYLAADAIWGRGVELPWRGEVGHLALDGAQVVRLEPARLASKREYVLRGVEPELTTRFVAGSRDDVTAPAPPVVRAVSLTATESGERPQLDVGIVLDTGFDPDVALLRVVITHEGRRWSAISTPDGWRCGWPPGVSRTPPFQVMDHVSLAVTAIDLAGNESGSTMRELQVGHARRWRCGGTAPPAAVLGGLATMFGLCVLGAVALVRHFRRVRAMREAVPEAISLLVVERLARAVQRRGGLVATVGIVGVPALMVTEASVLAIISTIVGCIGLRGFFVARAVLQLIERAPLRRAVEGPGAPHATAAVRGSLLIVRRGEEEAQLEVAPAAVVRARAHAVPVSVARRS